MRTIRRSLSEIKHKIQFKIIFNMMKKLNDIQISIFKQFLNNSAEFSEKYKLQVGDNRDDLGRITSSKNQFDSNDIMYYFA